MIPKSDFGYANFVPHFDTFIHIFARTVIPFPIGIWRQGPSNNNTNETFL